MKKKILLFTVILAFLLSLGTTGALAATDQNLGRSASPLSFTAECRGICGSVCRTNTGCRVAERVRAQSCAAVSNENGKNAKSESGSSVCPYYDQNGECRYYSEDKGCGGRSSGSGQRKHNSDCPNYYDADNDGTCDNRCGNNGACRSYK